MSRFWKIFIGAVVALPVMAFAAIWFWSQQNLARPTDEALAALVSDARVTVDEGRWLTFRPAERDLKRGVIVYPGANCDIRGYGPLLRDMALAGYTVVAVPMPLNLAVLAPDSATDIRAAFTGIDDWVIIGHSMGGAMAGYYAFNHAADLRGVIFWDAYPPQSNDLSDTGLPVWHIHRALPDGTAPEKFQAMAGLFPEDSTWIPVPGGIHMYFGSFNGGGYVEEWVPQISREEQLEIVSDATIAALAAMFARQE